MKQSSFEIKRFEKEKAQQVSLIYCFKENGVPPSELESWVRNNSYKFLIENMRPYDVLDIYQYDLDGLQADIKLQISTIYKDEFSDIYSKLHRFLMTYKLKDKCERMLAEFESFKGSEEDFKKLIIKNSKYDGYFVLRVFDINGENDPDFIYAVKESDKVIKFKREHFETQYKFMNKMTELRNQYDIEENFLGLLNYRTGKML